MAESTIVLIMFMVVSVACVYLFVAFRADRSEEQTKLMLDSAPLCTQLWNKEGNIIDCNEAAVSLFGYESKQEYMEKWFNECIPEFQPDGTHSYDKAKEWIARAFEEGLCKFNWTHQMPDGSPLPGEVTLVRVKYKNDYIVAGYTRDLRTEKQLEEQAQAAKHAKAEFLARTSHEMLTPMNAITGMTQIAISTDNPQERKACLSEVYVASHDMLNLINGLLDILGMEYGTFRIAMSEFDRDAVILDILHTTLYNTTSKQQSFTHNIDPSIPAVLIGDEHRIKQVVNSLLSNAVKFTPEGGKVSVNVSAIEGSGDEIMLRFEIADTGVGIGAEHQSEIFSLFEQIDGSSTRAQGGIGIGLSLSRRIARMMGGDITLQSTPGKGSTFVFTCRVRRG